MAIDPTLYDGYIGTNAAHRAFKREIVNAKVLFFQIHGNREQLKTSFEEKINDARKNAPGSFSIGMVTEVFSQTQFRALNIPHNEADLLAQDYDSLGYPLKAGQLGVGHVRCSAEFHHEFSHPSEDRPT